MFALELHVHEIAVALEQPRADLHGELDRQPCLFQGEGDLVDGDCFTSSSARPTLVSIVCRLWVRNEAKSLVPTAGACGTTIGANPVIPGVSETGAIAGSALMPSVLVRALSNTFGWRD